MKWVVVSLALLLAGCDMLFPLPGQPQEPIEQPAPEPAGPDLVAEWVLSAQSNGQPLARVSVYREIYTHFDLEIEALSFIEAATFSVALPDCLVFDNRDEHTQNIVEMRFNRVPEGETRTAQRHDFVEIAQDCDPRAQITYNVTSRFDGARGYLFFEWPKITDEFQ